MKLIPIKLSELNKNERYHVYDDNAHTYFSSHFDAERKVFITEVADSPYAEELRPREIKAVGAEIMTDRELHSLRTGSTINIIEE